VIEEEGKSEFQKLDAASSGLGGAGYMFSKARPRQPTPLRLAIVLDRSLALPLSWHGGFRSGFLARVRIGGWYLLLVAHNPHLLGVVDFQGNASLCKDEEHPPDQSFLGVGRRLGRSNLTYQLDLAATQQTRARFFAYDCPGLTASKAMRMVKQTRYDCNSVWMERSRSKYEEIDE
jgi:hypothetical protein